MKVFRLVWIQKLTTLLTGLIFLNMSFFLAEVKALKLLDRDKKMVENIAKLIAGSATEEEKDVFGGPDEDVTSMKEVDLLLTSHSHSSEFYLLPLQLSYKTDDGAKPITGILETINPPPEA